MTIDQAPASPLEPSGSRPSLIWFWSAAVLVAVLDLWTKAMVLRELPLGAPPVEVVGDVFRLRHVRNTGGLFGLFPGNALVFAGVSVVAVAVILTILYRSPGRERVQQFALGLVLGGAIGNFHDRIRYQNVVDFVDVGVGGHRWPTFNVADSGVSVGVVLLVIWLTVHERRHEREKAASGEDARGGGDPDPIGAGDRTPGS